MKENRHETEAGHTNEPVLTSRKFDIPVSRFFVTEGQDPYDSVVWQRSNAEISSPLPDGGKKIFFSQPNVEFPASWSQRAVDTVCSKYFYGRLGTEDREYSFKQVVDRVVTTLLKWGLREGYFEIPQRWAPGGRNGHASFQYFSTEREREYFHNVFLRNDLHYQSFQDYVREFHSMPGLDDHPIAFRTRFLESGTQVPEYLRHLRWLGLPKDHPGRVWAEELVWICLHQVAAFNSPVWFNLGVKENPQCSACFITGVEDSLDSLTQLQAIETQIFKSGSGSGVNISNVRSKEEGLSNGGVAAGPMRFVRALDANAGALHSGSKTRRPAKMVIMDDNHLDLPEFIESKQGIEEIARSLLGINVLGSLDSVSDILPYQNANQSVRVSDAFMRAVLDDGDWMLSGRKHGPSRTKQVSARALFEQMAQAAYACGDPGIQFDDTINRMHTCPADGKQRASNPCSEYFFLDDTSCNLATLGLRAFWKTEDSRMDVAAFAGAIETIFLAQDIIVDSAGYPTERHTKATKRYRTIGLNYADLATVLLLQGLPYDSDNGRTFAAGLTHLMTALAYKRSAQIAAARGPAPCFDGPLGTKEDQNRQALLNVLQTHASALDDLILECASEGNGSTIRTLLLDTQLIWTETLILAQQHACANAQATVLAPTGTTSFMLDCDSTGCEPLIQMVFEKLLSGGGILKLPFRPLTQVLQNLGYSTSQTASIVKFLGTNSEITECPTLKHEHHVLFETAFGKNSLSPEGHVRMLAALQPALSGGISKTCNLPSSASVQKVQDIMLLAWRLGCKSVAVYRDGSKAVQPLSVKSSAISTDTNATMHYGERKVLSQERDGRTRKFSIGRIGGYLTVNLFEDGTPGEIMIRLANSGSEADGMAQWVAKAMSLALQHGTPLETLVSSMQRLKFEPSGFTGDQDIPFCHSIPDYVGKWLTLHFLPKEEVQTRDPNSAPTRMCSCGGIMFPVGSCYSCTSCGQSSGCG